LITLKIQADEMHNFSNLFR